MKRRSFLDKSLVGLGAMCIVPQVFTQTNNTLFDTPEYRKIWKEWKKCCSDPVYFIEKYCVIKTPYHEEARRFKLTPQQKSVVSDLQKHTYNIFKKSRQIGMSYILIAYALWKNIFTFYPHNILFVSYNRQSAQYLSSVYSYMFDNLVQFKPQKKEWNKLEKIHNSGMGGSTSCIKFSSFSNVERAAHSQSFNLEIYDEFAFSETPILNKSRNIIITSTPSGNNNYFYKIWKGKNIFNKRTITRGPVNFNSNNYSNRRRYIKLLGNKSYKQEILAKFV